MSAAYRVPAALAAVTSLALLGVAGSASAAATSPTPSPSSPVAAPAGTGSTQQTVTFGIGAATAKGLDKKRDHLNYLVDPGSRIGDHIALVNLAYKPVSLLVYTAEASNAADGAIAYAPRADPGREARTWISIAGAGPSKSIVVKARSSAIVPIAISVPTTATPGDHVVGVMASVTSKVRTTTGQNPRLEQRIALRAFFRVSGVLKPQLTIAGLKASYAGTANPIGRGRATVTYTVRNTGNVDLGGNQKLRISGLFGSTGSSAALPQIPLLLPGGSIPVRAVVKDVLPEVYLHAKVTITPLGAVGAANPALKTVSAETGFWAVPWTLLVIVVVLLLAGIGWWRWRKAHPASARHRPAPGSRTPVAAGKV